MESCKSTQDHSLLFVSALMSNILALYEFSLLLLRSMIISTIACRVSSQAGGSVHCIFIYHSSFLRFLYHDKMEFVTSGALEGGRPPWVLSAASRGKQVVTHRVGMWRKNVPHGSVSWASLKWFYDYLQFYKVYKKFLQEFIETQFDVDVFVFQHDQDLLAGNVSLLLCHYAQCGDGTSADVGCSFVHHCLRRTAVNNYVQKNRTHSFHHKLYSWAEEICSFLLMVHHIYWGMGDRCGKLWLLAFWAETVWFRINYKERIWLSGVSIDYWSKNSIPK